MGNLYLMTCTAVLIATLVSPVWFHFCNTKFQRIFAFSQHGRQETYTCGRNKAVKIDNTAKHLVSSLVADSDIGIATHTVSRPIERYTMPRVGNRKAVTNDLRLPFPLICFVLPAVLSWVFCEILRKKGWIKENDLKLDL